MNKNAQLIVKVLEEAAQKQRAREAKRQMEEQQKSLSRIEGLLKKRGAAEEERAKKEEFRRNKISRTKKGKGRANPQFAVAYVRAEELYRGLPGITANKLYMNLQRDLPLGTDIPSIRQLGRFLRDRRGKY